MSMMRARVVWSLSHAVWQLRDVILVEARITAEVAFKGCALLAVLVSEPLYKVAEESTTHLVADCWWFVGRGCSRMVADDR